MSINILHISDLHLESFNSIESMFNDKNYNLKLIKKLNNEKIDYIFVTGDLANTGNEEEYKNVSRFLSLLTSKLNVKKNEVFIIPGNHDINWKKNKIAFHKINAEAIDDNEELLEKDSYTLHNEKFEDFKNFYNDFYNDEKIKFETQKAIFRSHIININSFEINILSINSNFKESFYKENHYGYIDYDSLEDELNKYNKEQFKIALFHHIPVVLNDSKSIKNWDSEIKFLCNENNIHAFIFGHQHSSQSTKIKENNYEFVELSVGTLGKKDSDVENTFNLLKLDYDKKDNNIIIELRPFHYITHNRTPDWHELTDSIETLPINTQKLYEVNNTEAKNILPEEFVDKYTFPKEIELFSEKLVNIIKQKQLFKSGHFHWNPTTRTLGIIDTYTLLSNNNNSLVAKGSLMQLIKTNDISAEYILGLGQEGIILGEYISRNMDTPFSYIPYLSRKKDHSKHEGRINLKGINSIIIVTDVVQNASSLMNLINIHTEEFSSISNIILISLFYTSPIKDYNPNIFKENDKRIKYYTVCDKIKIDKCRYNDKEYLKCPILCNNLEKVHIFYNKEN